MANKNHKINLLCDTNQMAYGSSSALLAILEYLPSINTAFVWGVTEKILKSSEFINEIIKINNKDENLIKKNVDLRKFDAVLVISNTANLNTYLDFGIPVFYVDIHFWYPSNKKHRIWQEAKQCFVERYFKDDIQLPNNSIEVGPIISLIKKNTRINKQILVNIGGGANRFIKPGINSKYINIVLQLLNQIRKEKEFENYDFIIAGGQASINSIKNCTVAKGFILKSFNKKEFLKILSGVEYFFTSPGQYATFEGLYLEKKIIFLPPQNASQIIQIDILENVGLIKKGINLSDYYSHFRSLGNNSINEQELTNEVLIALEELENNSEVKTKIISHLREQIINTSKSSYFQEQKKFIDILGLPGAETIANEIKLSFGINIPYLDEAKYRKRAIKLWNIDPHSLVYLQERFAKIKGDKNNFTNQFANLLHAVETLLFENIYKLDESKNEIQQFIDEICFKYEEYNPNRDFSIKIAITTTNSEHAVHNLIASATMELEKSKFNCVSEKPIIEILVIENSTEQTIIESNQKICMGFNNSKVKIHYVSKANKKANTGNPFSIAQSRVFLIKKINSLGWKASTKRPIWILDDDFEITMTIPAKDFEFENIRVGSVFHRLECLANENKLDAIVGGNSGSSPVPELSTIRLQLKDLKNILAPNYQQPCWASILKNIQENPDYYYDLSRIEIDYFEVLKAISNEENRLDFIDFFLKKLLTGLPASRYLFANYDITEEYNSAWNVSDDTAVSGGNTIYYNSDLLNSNTYWGIEYKGIKSRRADAVWFLLNKQKEYKIKKMNFALTHARNKRISDECDVTNLITKSLKDILGVALWEIIKEKQYSEIEQIETDFLHKKIISRQDKFNNSLFMAEELLKDISKNFPEISNLKSFNMLLELSNQRNKIELEQIKLVNYGS
jgi:hypothetical protein